VGLVSLAIFYSFYRKQITPDDSVDMTLETLSEEKPSVTNPSVQSLNLSSKQSDLLNRKKVTNGDSLENTSIPASKQERIFELYADMAFSYSFDGPHPKEIEILTEGMDTLNAAKYLKALGYFDYAREYAARALVENPESFEGLLLWSQLRPPDQEAEREAGFRKLLEMNPNSVDALVELGAVLAPYQPLEAIQYLQKANRINPLYGEGPSRGVGHSELGFCYERLGEYDKALVAYQKACEISQSPAMLAHIRAIESGNPIVKPLQRESQEQVLQGTFTDETSPKSPLQ
jgi:Tfp pilus assembly protein PilF